MGPVELHHLRRPVVLAAFSGWNDAGDAATGVLDHLTETCETEFVFALDPDDYYDFTENRPVLVRDGDGERSLQWATTEVLLARLPERDLLLISGPEPNLRWKAFCGALVSLLRSVRPEHVVVMGAMLADTPHSRPIPITENGTDYEGPSGIVGVFAGACREAGLEVTSVWASVPHYVADPPNPKATLALLSWVADVIDTPLEVGELPQAATTWEGRVNELLTEETEIAEYVATLEERYDTAEATGEQIALQFERYLRRRER